MRCWGTKEDACPIRLPRHRPFRRRRIRCAIRCRRLIRIRRHGRIAIRSCRRSPGPASRRCTIRYRRPTPLQAELVFTGRTERVSGRKIYVKGTVHAGDTLTAEADGLFVNLARPTAAEYFENDAS